LHVLPAAHHRSQFTFYVLPTHSFHNIRLLWTWVCFSYGCCGLRFTFAFTRFTPARTWLHAHAYTSLLCPFAVGYRTHFRTRSGLFAAQVWFRTHYTLPRLPFSRTAHILSRFRFACIAPHDIATHAHCAGFFPTRCWCGCVRGSRGSRHCRTAVYRFIFSPHAVAWFMVPGCGLFTGRLRLPGLRNFLRTAVHPTHLFLVAHHYFLTHASLHVYLTLFLLVCGLRVCTFTHVGRTVRDTCVHLRLPKFTALVGTVHAPHSLLHWFFHTRSVHFTLTHLVFFYAHFHHVAWLWIRLVTYAAVYTYRFIHTTHRHLRLFPRFAPHTLRFAFLTAVASRSHTCCALITALRFVRFYDGLVGFTVAQFISPHTRTHYRGYTTTPTTYRSFTRCLLPSRTFHWHIVLTRFGSVVPVVPLRSFTYHRFPFCTLEHTVLFDLWTPSTFSTHTLYYTYIPFTAFIFYLPTVHTGFHLHTPAPTHTVLPHLPLDLFPHACLPPHWPALSSCLPFSQFLLLPHLVRISVYLLVITYKEGASQYIKDMGRPVYALRFYCRSLYAVLVALTGVRFTHLMVCGSHSRYRSSSRFTATFTLRFTDYITRVCAHHFVHGLVGTLSWTWLVDCLRTSPRSVGR